MIALAALLLLQAPPTALASTTSDSALPADPVLLDEDWIRREEGGSASQVYLAAGSQATLLGDLDGDGLFDAPGDVDALCWHPLSPGTGPSPFDVLFSTLTNGPGYEDGDLLRFSPTQGLIVEVAEADFLAVLQPSSGGFDLDAAAWRAPDEFWFSVSSTLTGTVLGDVLDGDVLVFDRAAMTVRREHSEADMQAFVDNAQGAPAAAIGEVLALSFYPATGELLFSVQSGSAYDGSVFGTGSGGRVLPGWEEGDWGFQSAAELDALCFLPDGAPQPPLLAADGSVLPPLSPVHFDVRHGTPGGVLEGFLSRGHGYLDRPGEGIGFLYLDIHDPLLRRLARRGRTHSRVLDASGATSFDWITPELPASVPSLDLYLQVLDLDSQGWSAPVRLRVE